jgi:signal transduction histidine kinase
MSLPRKLPIHGSVRFKLFRLILLVSLLALSVSLIGSGMVEWRQHRDRVSQSIDAAAKATGIAASAAIAFADSKAATEALQILAPREYIQAAALYTLTGKRLASYGDSDGLPEQSTQLSEHLPAFDLFSTTTTLFQPILLDGSAIGQIYLRANLQDFRKSFLLQVFMTLVASGFGLLLALGLGARFIEHIVKPVRELAETAHQVRERNDFSLRATPVEKDQDPDEITDLVDSFNAMLEEIERRERELVNYHDNLERMVLERTSALHAANRELQVAKSAAEAASLSKSRFLAAASHDLRQPIQAINLFSSALLRSRLNDDQLRISRYIEQSASSLGELLNALLDISKLDSGTITPTLARVDIHALLSVTTDKFSPFAMEKSLRFNVHYPHDDIALLTDGKVLQSLLDNLVSNAIKYTELGGVLVSLRRRGNQILIQIWDTGIGLAPAHQTQIFDEYYQVGNPERDNSKGLGLGLAIAKRLADLLGTEITCRSRPGRGTVFGFWLPLADSPAPPAHAEPPPVSAANGADAAPSRVVVIDDNAMVIKAMMVSLESSDLEMTSYFSAEEALADASIADADFYISDLNLPGIDGIELLDAIQRRAQRRINAILLTGDTAPDRVDRVRCSGWPVLYKPVDLQELMAAIEMRQTGS